MKKNHNKVTHEQIRIALAYTPQSTPNQTALKFPTGSASPISLPPACCVLNSRSDLGVHHS
jgi:hypothetical protein